MVQTRNNQPESIGVHPDPIDAKWAPITSRIEIIESLFKDLIASLKARHNPFPNVVKEETLENNSSNDEEQSVHVLGVQSKSGDLDQRSSSREIRLVTRDEMTKLLPINWQKTKDHKKLHDNLKCCELKFEGGDVAFQQTQPYHRKRPAERPFQKLPPRTFGQYQIIRKAEAVAYELEVPSKSQVHSVFLVTMLTLAHIQVSTTTVAHLLVTKIWEISPQSQLPIEWLIAWHNNSFIFDLRTSRFSGPEVLICSQILAKTIIEKGRK